MPHLDRQARQRQRGMTLIEIVVAITILSGMVTVLYQIIGGTLRGKRLAEEALQTPKIENAVLGPIFKDFRYIYWGGISNDAGFLGKNGTRGGRDADQVQFITARTTRVAGSGSDSQRQQNEIQSPLTEVGYALRVNEREGGGEWLELWRREDYFVDVDPVNGGVYTLIYDKIRRFNLRYYPTPETSTNKEGFEEWDSRLRHGLPYAIILEMELDVLKDEEGFEDRTEPHRITRIILIRGAYNVRFTDPANDTEQPGTG